MLWTFAPPPHCAPHLPHSQLNNIPIFEYLLIMKDKLLRWATTRPRQVFAITGVLALVAMSQMLRVRVDTDPENMLPESEPARAFHTQMKERFALHDMVVVGVSHEGHPSGVFNPTSLARIHQLSRHLESVEGVVTKDMLDISHVDNIQQAGPGTVRFSWMMQTPPATQADADRLRADIARIPFLAGTIMSEDQKSIAILVPLKHKSDSYRVVEAVEDFVQETPGPEALYFAGLPIAEETFGVEMFKQMAIAAPLAAVAIFLLMLFFFRSALLVSAPMLVAMSTVIITMGALIGGGFTVHIMSSMIPIFLMPIAVVDSVHLLSEFSDEYPKSRDAKATIEKVTAHLFQPMLFTSVTSALGFVSLLLTPIPPVRVFGCFVGLGIALAFWLTIVLIPAFVVSLPKASLEKLLRASEQATKSHDGHLLARLLRQLGALAAHRSKPILALSLLLLVGGGYGISQIQVNDNPVRWFRESHEIRVADAKLNKALAGTYPAYLVFSAVEAEPVVDAVTQRLESDRSALDAWKTFRAKLPADAAEERLVEALETAIDDGTDALEPALEALEAEQQARRLFQNPAWLSYLEQLQDTLTSRAEVGKTSSLADVVKTVYRELRGGDQANYVIPESASGVAQTLLSFQSSHRPHDLWHLTTPDYRSGAVWFQLKSGDNQDMLRLHRAVDEFVRANPPPAQVEMDWAGLTHLNVVWQDKMVFGMLESLAGAFIAVFLVMSLLFRSPLYGLLSMVPLSMTIILVYGALGITGKDYDMPVAVLSSLTLGLSVDFAIHYLERARSIHRETQSWAQTLRAMSEEPARAITRNAIVIALGFLPLLVSPLVPYNTVGILMAAIMSVSGFATLVLLPAILSAFSPTPKAATRPVALKGVQS